MGCSHSEVSPSCLEKSPNNVQVARFKSALNELSPNQIDLILFSWKFIDDEKEFGLMIMHRYSKIQWQS